MPPSPRESMDTFTHSDTAVHPGPTGVLRERRVHAALGDRRQQGHGQRPSSGAQVLRACAIRGGCRARWGSSHGSGEHSTLGPGGRGVLLFVHGRSRMTVDHRPSHPCNAGMEDVGFTLTRQTLLAPSAKRREVLGESHEG